MPRAYSEDLCWRAICLTEIMGFQIDDVSILLVLNAVGLKNTRYRILVIMYALKLERNYYAL